MREGPSERNRAVVAYRDAGHTQKETADHFNLSLGRTRQIEQRTRDYLEAAEALKSDPDNIVLLARTGHLPRLAANGMAERGVLHISQLEGLSLRDLLAMRNVNRRAVEALARLAAERGVELEGEWPSGPNSSPRE
jgi:hypothetical protein